MPTTAAAPGRSHWPCACVEQRHLSDEFLATHPECVEGAEATRLSAISRLTRVRATKSDSEVYGRGGPAADGGPAVDGTPAASAIPPAAAPGDALGTTVAEAAEEGRGGEGGS